MELTRMHMFLIICFAFILAIVILIFSGIWACSVAGFIAFIALIYMLNDFFEDRKIERSIREAEAEKTVVSEKIDESYPEWARPKLSGASLDVDAELSRKKAVELYAHLFSIDDVRGKNLYGAGYYSIRMLSEAELGDLIKVPGINPTIARKIQKESRAMVKNA
jgi:hypothetical protein